jgi:hypothetical protein
LEQQHSQPLVGLVAAARLFLLVTFKLQVVRVVEHGKVAEVVLAVT